MMKPACLAVVFLLAGAEAIVARKHGSLRKPEPESSPESKSVVKPLTFDQRLLVCNAYPHKTPVKVSKNSGQKVLAKEGGLGFKECEYSAATVKAHDKLDFELADLGVEGTFEVGDLPESDAVLLLVLERRDEKSSVVSFQSFAFPSSKEGESDAAQVAVIDTFKGASKFPHLKMQDHSDAKDAKKEGASKRVEELNFNRVYAVEEGSYDASVMDRLEDKAAEKKLEKYGTLLKLEKGRDYVVLRTGDDKDFPMSLVAFPPASGANKVSVITGLLLVLLAQLIRF